MTDPVPAPEAAEAAETAHFLRRFADLMSNGQNADYLMRAADLLDALMARATIASDEEQLWRYKYETLTHQTDELEAECESLRHDIERHVKLSSFIITERDTFKATLQGREAELQELGNSFKQSQDALKREQEAAAAKSQAHEMARAELRYGHNEPLRRMAQEIIVTQLQEITAMRLSLGQPLPPSVPSPDQVPPAAKSDAKIE